MLLRRVASVHPALRHAVRRHPAVGAARDLLRAPAHVRAARGHVRHRNRALLRIGVASVFMLRRKASYNPPFRVPLYPFVPGLFVIATIYLLANALIDPSSRWATAAVLGIVVLGVPLYYVTGRARR